MSSALPHKVIFTVTASPGFITPPRTFKEVPGVMVPLEGITSINFKILSDIF